MKYAEIKKYDIANGPGLRVSIFVCGCTHRCEKCFNQELWDPEYGDLYTEETEKEILDFMNSKYVTGLSLLGGDPLDFGNYKTLLSLVKEAKKIGKDVWCYTGSLYEQIWEKCESDPILEEFLSYVDIIVDGPFINSLKDPMLKFRGSSNQRIIDNKKTIENHLNNLSQSENRYKNIIPIIAME